MKFKFEGGHGKYIIEINFNLNLKYQQMFRFWSICHFDKAYYSTEKLKTQLFEEEKTVKVPIKDESSRIWIKS